MKKLIQKIGNYLQQLGARLAGNRVYSVPEPGGTFNPARCECGHLFSDHRPDPDGHGTICLACFALVRHRPQEKDILEAREIEYVD